MKKHTIHLTIKNYFLLKDYFAQLNQIGEFKNNYCMQQFYKSFVLESSINISKDLNLFKDSCIIQFELKEEYNYLLGMSLYCKEKSLETKSKNSELSYALAVLGHYFNCEFMNYIE